MCYSRKGILFVLIFLFSELAWPQNTVIREKGKYWVFFHDKGSRTIAKTDVFSQAVHFGISNRALQRRAKVRSEGELIDAADLPVEKKYIQVLEALGLKPHVVSRWLNAVSVTIPAAKLDHVRSLPFVKKIQPVSSFISRPMPKEPKRIHKNVVSLESHHLDYGDSYEQNHLIRIPEVHDLEFTGEGVLIGLIDTGFDYKDRPVFSHLRILKEYDFHWADSVTANENNDPSYQHDHGTQVLSIIAGFREGYLIGPAYNASFALAKTEWVPTETRLEEDDWVAGIEWLEGLGVDVVSSSLGYGIFDDGSGYTYEDLNGDTCVTTIAADLAASRGVVVVTSAGNQDFWPYIDCPADGDSVIAVGAVDRNGNWAPFSSVGPTYDGRTKPDVMAMGVGVYTVNPFRNDPESYLSVWGGTSASCPLVAGVCALLLQARPELGPMDVRDAIRNTADRAASRNNVYGWGIVDAYKALFYHGMIFTHFQTVSLPAESRESIEVDILSNTGIASDSVSFVYQNGEEEFRRIPMSPLRNQGHRSFRAIFPSLNKEEKLKFYIEAVDSLGEKHVGPVGAPDILYSFSDTSGTTVFLPTKVPTHFFLYPNFPNPFNAETTIEFDIAERSHVILQVFDVLGRHVVTLLDEILNAGEKRVYWRGRDQQGLMVSSGLYFCVMRVEGKKQVRKMMVIK